MDYFGLYWVAILIKGLIEGYMETKTELALNKRLENFFPYLRLGPKYFLFWWAIFMQLPFTTLVLLLALTASENASIVEFISNALYYILFGAIIYSSSKIITKTFWYYRHQYKCGNPSQCFYCKPDEEEQDETLFQLGLGDNFQSSYFRTDCANKEKVKR